MHQTIVAIQLDAPAIERAFSTIDTAVEVRVVPHVAVQDADTDDAADIDGDARIRRARRIVPGDHAGVGDSGADRQIAIDHRAETQDGGLPRLQRTIRRRVIRRNYRVCDTDAGGYGI